MGGQSVVRNQVSTLEPSEYAKHECLPGELLTCEICSQQPESLAFDIHECRDSCPLRFAERQAPDLVP